MFIKIQEGCVSRFDATENRINLTHQRFPGYPREPAMLVRLVKAISQHVDDLSLIHI